MREINFIKKKASRYQNGFGYRFNKLPYIIRQKKSYLYPQVFKHMAIYKTWCIVNGIYCGEYKMTLNGHYYFDNIEQSCIDAPIMVGKMLRDGNMYGYAFAIGAPKNVGWVVLYKNVLKNKLNLNDYECDAVYYHEVGHIATSYWIYNEIEREYIADEYAAKMINIDTVISKLEKILESNIPNDHSRNIIENRLNHMFFCKENNTLPLYDKYVLGI